MIENEKPLISIVTVSYNSEKTIENTIQSVLGQSYSNIEYIIVDGASTDHTLEIIKHYEPLFLQKNIAYNFISEPDGGIYEAMNKGIALCTGLLIGMINSDDWYESNAVEEIVTAYNQNKEYDIFHGLLRVVNEDNLPDYIVGHHSRFLTKGMIEHPTCFVKSNCYNEIGLFDTRYKSAADYEWMLRANKASLKFLFSNSLIASFRLGGMSSSKTGHLEDLDIRKKYDILPAREWHIRKMYINLSFFIKGIIKK